MKGNTLYCFLLAILFLSVNLTAGTKTSERLSLKKLLSAPDTLIVAGQRLVLSAYLWRDFMPISPPDGKPLRAVVTIKPVDAEYLPPGIDADQVWVIYRQEIWSQPLESVSGTVPQERLKILEKVARDGPKWGPGVYVTVVVQIRDPQGKTHLLKAERQFIERTD